MAEKERQRAKSQSSEEVTHVVSVMGDTFRVSLPKGATLKDLLAKFKAEHSNKNLENISTIMVNGVPVEVKKGEPTYNPVLTEGAVVQLLANFTGGF